MAGNSTALAAVLALVAQPLLSEAVLAQDRQDTPSLEDLIPDSAVEDPEGWAAQGVSAEAQAEEGTALPLDPDAPLDDSLVSIPWPEQVDLPEITPLEPDAEPIEFVTFDEDIPPIPAGSEERISDELVLVFPDEQSLFPQREEFLERFRSLSTIQELEDDDNIARLAVQARGDQALLEEMLRVYGYYDAQVIRSVGNVIGTDEANLDRPAARFDIIPGERYAIGAIDLGNLAAAGDDYDTLRSAFEVNVGDPISLDAIKTEQADLDVALGENGFPFAAIEEPALLIDHARVEGDLTMAVEPGGQYNFGVVTSSIPEFLSGEHLSDIARWDPGDIYQRSDEMDLRRAILATGIVGSVQLTPVVVEEPVGDQPGTVNIAAELTEAPLRTLAGNIGFGTEEGIRLEGMWEHRNLFPPEGLLRVRGILGTQEQLAGVTFRKNNFGGRDRILTLDAYASTIDYDLYDARTVSLVGNYERLSTLLFQKEFSWSVGIELVASQESEVDAEGNPLQRETYFVAALPLFAQLDQSDDLLDPTSGYRLSARLSPEASDNDGVQSFYVRSQVDASYYQSMGENTVLAGRVRLASIPGAELEGIAPSRRLYAGGGGSVRGYGYRSIGPVNQFGNPTGGRSLVELSAEARIRTGFLDGAVSVVPFIDAGSVSEGTTPDFGSIKLGAGVGVRYATGFGPLRLDVAVPLNRGPNDSWVAVYVALGQAF
ncbi:BamA/TamA family outer membrane protein [Erythrobacter arachoides]|uniref:BamA/TamA family outer membrane protein n=1 Tax=Aurantiacibacter arachoides TaxID=1850444 RepID=A0A845A4D2_9SPHN|nr:BamA/TamA family outer membrane protein [Aurantiacibacter arachoides]MXO92449.1 BamA/TamA family outer membrane protein [Aurantiacibacter arachoides]GGD57093.1 outer membrane protein assembly factor [Aurantiacibacter arachoides]